MTDLVDALMAEEDAPELVGQIVIDVYADGTLHVASDLGEDDTDAVLISACTSEPGPTFH